MKKPKRDLAATLAAIAVATQKRKGPLCRVCALPAEWLEGVHGARDKHNTEYTGIARGLRAEGFNITDSIVQHHFQHHR